MIEIDRCVSREIFSTHTVLIVSYTRQCNMSGDIDQALADDNRWIVVDILHPTRRVCIVTNEVDLYKSSYFSLTRSKESYSTMDEAIEKAREVRRNSSHFEHYDEFYGITEYDSDSAEYSEDDEVELSYEERVAGNEPNLPWSSHVLSNRENDQENLIDVMTVEDYLKEVSRINAILKAEGEERETKEEKIRLATNSRIKEQGEVYYSFSLLRGIIDIPAIYELLIKDGEIYQVPRDKQLDGPVLGMDSFQLSKLSFCSSIQIQTCNVKFSERSKELLESIITNAPNLKELHWHGVNDLSRYISGSNILRDAFDVLEVLSLPYGCIYPHDIVQLQSCTTSLRR